MKATISSDSDEDNGFVYVPDEKAKLNIELPVAFNIKTRSPSPPDLMVSNLAPKATPKVHPKYDPAEDLGMLSPKPLLFLILWYFFSGLTLFVNKYIVKVMQGSEALLGCTQMICTLLGGLLQLYYPLGMFPATPVRHHLPKGFNRNMMIVGGLRYTTVLLGIFALDYLEISFTETVKSTAPAFTVIISRMLLGEETGMMVKLSLIPVMAGLALCSANELSFRFIGFLAALGTNISECLQNVYSKMLISSKNHKYTPAEVQYYTSKFSLVVQVPCLLFLLDWSSIFSFVGGKESPDINHMTKLFLLCVINGIFFHFQTITAYVLMDFISPVTHSVANTGKRALLIWLSVLLFGNPVTFFSGLGTVVVIAGVLLYNKARELDAGSTRISKSIHDDAHQI